MPADLRRRACCVATGRLLMGLAAAPALLPGCAGPAARTGLPMVLTLDDGPMLAPMPLRTPAQRHAAYRAALADAGITATMFMTLGFGADRPEGLALARAWGDAGHRLANHTVTHLDLHDPQVTLARYAAEIDACDTVGRTLPGWRRWFRATYLNEGADAAQRAALRQALADRGYVLAAVDLDSRDWQFSAPLQTLLLSQSDPEDPGVRSMQAQFLGQLHERAAQRARAVRDAPSRPGTPSVLLVHDHLPMALWMPQTLAVLRDAGFRFVAPEAAWPAHGAGAGAG